MFGRDLTIDDLKVRLNRTIDQVGAVYQTPEVALDDPKLGTFKMTQEAAERSIGLLQARTQIEIAAALRDVADQLRRLS